jgi:hypothetical protein
MECSQGDLQREVYARFLAPPSDTGEWGDIVATEARVPLFPCGRVLESIVR